MDFSSCELILLFSNRAKDFQVLRNPKLICLLEKSNPLGEMSSLNSAKCRIITASTSFLHYIFLFSLYACLIHSYFIVCFLKRLPQIQRYKDTMIHRYKGTKIQRHKDTKIQRYKGKNIKKKDKKYPNVLFMFSANQPKI